MVLCCKILLTPSCETERLCPFASSISSLKIIYQCLAKPSTSYNSQYKSAAALTKQSHPSRPKRPQLPTRIIVDKWSSTEHPKNSVGVGSMGNLRFYTCQKGLHPTSKTRLQSSNNTSMLWHNHFADGFDQWIQSSRMSSMSSLDEYIRHTHTMPGDTEITVSLGRLAYFATVS